MTQDRFRRYRTLFQELEIAGGMTCDLNPKSPGLYILAAVMVPIGGRSRSVGYFYSTRAPELLVKSLGVSAFPFQTRGDYGHKTVYRRLDAGWYLFYDSSS